MTAPNSNHSILTANTLLGLSEPAQLLYLTLLDRYQGHTDRRGEHRALFAATRFERRCAGTIAYILEHAPTMQEFPPSVRTSLHQFFAERWRHNFMDAQ